MFNLQCCQFQTCNILNLLNIYIYIHIHFLRFFSHIVHQSIEQKYSVLYCRSLLCVHVCVYACTCSQSLSCLQLFVTSWTIATRLLCPWNFPGKNTGGVATSFCRGSSQPGIETMSPASPSQADGFFITVLCYQLSILYIVDQFSSVAQSCLTLCNPMNCSATASLSITKSRSLLKLMTNESVMPFNHLTLCHPLLLLLSIFPSIRIFSNESALHIRWSKYWSFSYNISPSNQHPGLMSFRMDWLDLLAV